ncbi:Signal transduction histidine kinase [Neorhodopirellula lusitana]|uniref:histidine kinase n=2 Tax=Neorhodopirellula lusitana TaxID=445327 RepID=A0ABY1QKX5_9BACT|nr:Signal transduction histidine kinase [Neorhodopirellula lusitana]
MTDSTSNASTSSSAPRAFSSSEMPSEPMVIATDTIDTESQTSKRRKLSDASIRTKLLFLATASVAVALLMAFSGMAINDIQFIRSSKVEQLDSQAKMLAFNCAGVLTFQDETGAKELLRSMAMYPAVEYACVYDEKGKVFAEYQAEGVAAKQYRQVDVNQYVLDDSGVAVRQSIMDAGERIGSVYLFANMSDLHAHVKRYLSLCAVLMIGSLASAGMFAYLMQRSISTPIKELADATNTVKQKRDFTIRVQPASLDELGQLGGAFNAMLDEIQASKAALQAANDELENRVELRTAELTDEINQRQSIQEALETARDEAEAANRAKSEFLANMSHEIRTPLNGILGFTELLTSNSDGNDEATRQEYLQTISSSGSHLLELINDILDLSKIEAGQLDVELSPCSPHDVINQVVSVLRAKAQKKGLKLQCAWSSRVPESIVTDGGRLRQLLMNLVGNAIKFTKEGCVTIDAELDHFSEMLTVRVVDTGIGIPLEKQADIFSPFVQADNSVTRRYGGTGLGLAISERLSSALGGDLRVESVAGQGSVFTLKVKTGSLKSVALLDAPPADALIGTVEEYSADEIDLPAARILLVEDGEINRKLVRIMLEEAGATVVTAENGWAAVNATSKASYDLILMDMQMPVMDGYTAAKKMREEGLTTPIVALTAHAMKGDEEKCLDAGCTAYLTKPIQQVVLLREVLKHLTMGAETQESADAGQSLSASNPVESLVDRAAEESDAEVLTTDVGLKSTLPLENPVYREIVEEFVDFLQQHVADMQSAYADQQYDTLAQLAHALKGAGGTAGFDVLTEPAAKLQQSTKELTPEEVEVNLAELSDLTRRIRQTPQRA